MKDLFTIRDLNGLRGVSTPLRLAIVEKLSEEAMPVRKLADELGTSVHGLYYHLRALEKLGLIHVVKTRQRGNLTERFYRARARQIHVDPALFSAGRKGRGALVKAMRGVLDATAAQVDALALSKRASDECLMSYQELQLTPAQLGRLRRRLRETLDEFKALSNKGGPERVALGLVLLPAVTTS